MEKFLVTGEDITKDKLTEALDKAKLEATVEQNKVDVLIVDIHPEDVPGENTKEEDMTFLSGLNDQFISAIRDVIADNLDDDEEDKSSEDDDTSDDEEIEDLEEDNN